MNSDEIITIESENIIFLCEIEGNEYCAYIDSTIPNDENVYFALVSKIDNKSNSYVLTTIPDEVFDKVLTKFEEYEAELLSEDESDEEESEEQ